MKKPRLLFTYAVTWTLLINTFAQSKLPAGTHLAPADMHVREWYTSFMPASSPVVRQLPFRLPDVNAREVFDFSFVNFVATDNPLGGHPNNDIGDEARKALRDYLKTCGPNDVFFNGDEEFSDDGKDLIGDVAAIEERKAREKAAIFWVRNKVQLRSAIAASVKQVWKPGGSTMVPPKIVDTLNKYLQGEFDTLRNSLTDAQKALLAGWRVDVGTPPDVAEPGESLWLKPRSKRLWLSPFLIKGLLLQATESEAELEYDQFVANHKLTPKLFENPALLERVETQFHNSVRYLLAHSIGHVVLHDSAGSPAETENKVDEMVAAILGSKDLSALVKFLVEAIEVSDESNAGWGVEVVGDGPTFRKKFKT